MFFIITVEELIGGRHILRMFTWKKAKLRLARHGTVAAPIHVAFKAAVSTENIETSVIDRSSPCTD